MTVGGLSGEVAAVLSSGVRVTEMALVSVGATVRAGVTLDSMSVGPATRILKGLVRSRAHLLQGAWGGQLKGNCVRKCSLWREWVAARVSVGGSILVARSAQQLAPVLCSGCRPYFLFNYGRGG